MEHMFDLSLNIFTQGLPVCIMAIGIFLTFRLLDFADMTAEGSFLIGAAITVVCIDKGFNPFLVVLFATLGGAACGIITGVLNRILKIPKLLSGIITMTACGGLVFFIMGYDSLAETFNSAYSFDDGATTIYNIFFEQNKIVTSLTMLVYVIVIMLVIYFFFGTEYGMAIRTTGMNENMARAQGINTTLATIVCVAISNALIAMGSSLVYQQGGEVKLGIESGRLVIGLAAVLIGEAIFGKRTFKNWLISVALGAIIYYVIITIALNVGSVKFQNAMDSIKKLIYAILIVIALCLPMIKKGIKKLFTRKKVAE